MKAIFVLALGALTAFLTAKLNNWSIINIYSFALFFIVPVGGALYGFAANTGVYCAARLLHLQPGKALFAITILVASFASFLHYYLAYKAQRIGGVVPISSVMPFGDYLRLSITTAEIQVGTRRGVHGSMGQAGSGGYFFAIVDYVGAIIGGISMYFVLNGIARCPKCGNFQDAVAKRNLAFPSVMDRYAFQQSLTETVAGSEEFMKAMEQCSSLSTEDKTSANARLSLFRCCDCRTQTLEIVERKTSNDERDVTTRVEVPRGLALDRVLR